MNETKYNVFYKPDISIERRYDTTGTIPHPLEPSRQDNVHKTENEDILSRAIKTQDDLLQIRKVLGLLPPKTNEILKDIIDKLIFQAEEEKEELGKIIEADKKEEESKNPEKPHGGIEEYPEEPIEEKPESQNFWEDPDPMDLDIKIIAVKDIGDLAYEQYLKDSTEIKEDFVNKMNYVIQEYLSPLLNMISEIGLDGVEYLNLDYEGESITGIQPNDKHVHDTIVRNQLIVNEKNRKFSKTHSPNVTIATMIAFDVTSQERVQYYKEDYDLGIINISGIYKRNMLQECRNEYEAKYFIAKANMYKYLNSTVELTSDILTKALNTNAGKCHLLANNVNIYARRLYEEVGYVNSANDTTMDLEKDINAGQVQNNKPNNSTKVSKDKNSSNGKETEKKEDKDKK